MRAARRGQKGWIAAASLAVHAVVLTMLALHAPRLRPPKVASGPPVAVIPVLIMPRAPPPSAQPGAKPTPIRLHRRPQRFALEPLPLAPLVVPATEQAAPAPATGPKVLSLPRPEDTIAANARKALRGRLGCANANLLSLSNAEREACEDALAAGAREADFPGLGIEADKTSELARSAKRKEEDYKYKRAPNAANDRPALKIPF